VGDHPAEDDAEGTAAWPTTEQVEAAFLRCDRWIRWDGPRTADRLRGTIPEDVEADVYGAGGVVEELEAEVARVLGAPAAVAMPTGTMAQQIALRIWADRAGRRGVALHPTSHMLLWESHAHEWVHDLRTVRLGTALAPWTVGDVEGLGQPVAAVAVEVPLRELGGRLPAWRDLAALREAAGRRGAAVHLDGARIWEAAAGYGRTPADVAACADSTYVSFYKGLGAIAGAALVGDEDLVAEARVWRHRHGGQQIGMWPWAASALQALRTRLDRFEAHLAVARDVVARLDDVEGLEAVPAVPETSMVHLHLEVQPGPFRAAALALAEGQGIATFATCWPTARPRWSVVELSAGEATVAAGAEAVATAIRTVVADARRRGRGATRRGRQV
jgi:threonine aldolase